MLRERIPRIPLLGRHRCEDCGKPSKALRCDVCGQRHIERTRSQALTSHQHRW